MAQTKLTDRQAVQSVDLTSEVAGILPVVNGGTNTASLPTGLLVGAGTGAITAKTAPSGAVVGDTDTQTLSGKTLTSPLLTGVAGATYAAGKLVYDTDNESLTFFNNDSNVAMNLGQESWTRVRNATGSTIANGVPVYISGVDTGLPAITSARANAAATSMVMGLTTESIANNTTGYVTIAGLVRNFNTSAFSVGATVYLDSAAAGTLVSTAPSAAGTFVVPIGKVITSHATTGAVLVFPSYVDPAGILVSGGALGTPTSGNASNLTSFPTLNQNTTGSAATLTTARTINGVSFNGSANIVVVPRIGTTASTATPSIDCALYDQYNITALAANITSITVTNTYDGCKLAIRFTGTATRTITHGSSFQSSGVATLLATTSGTNTHMAFYVYDSVKAKFVCMAVDATGY
jgi:hypothetical protein